MKRVYVAGKLNDMTSGYIKNCHDMIMHADAIRRLGFSVFVPCLDLLSGLVAGDYDYKDYFENNMPWLECCDYLYVCPGYETSEGTKREIARAKELGKPVFFSIGTLVNGESHEQ